MRPATVSPIRMNSTNYYDLNADALAARYDGVDPADVHADWAPAHLREEPGFACDIGAGSGRDANWLAARGWEVVAVEPSALRNLATERAHPRVVWMEDALPDLRALRALGRRFDLVLLSAVWMHVAPKTRERAFRILSELLNPSGLLVITLRRGGDAAENAARGFHDTSAEELIGFANHRAIALRSHTTQPDLTRPGIHWETLVFAMPDDGTGSLPLLRHVIVNDNKSSTYKLGLLRILVRLAETAPGLVIARTDDYVEIPFGAVGLYWLKQYLPLVLHHGLPQRPPGPGGYGWAKEAFYRLQDFSPSDLRLGARMDSDRANILTRAINDACENIQRMPVRYITFPGSDDRQLFESGFSRSRATSRPIVLSREYLARFGRFRIPALLWQALGQFACWLDPVIVGEWRQLTSNWNRPADQHSDARRAANVGQSVHPPVSLPWCGNPGPTWQRTTPTNGPKAATTPASPRNGRSSCAMTDSRSPASGPLREFETLRTSTTVFRGRAGATTISGTCCRPTAPSTSERATGCLPPAPWPTRETACWNGGRTPGSTRRRRTGFSWKRATPCRGSMSTRPDWKTSSRPPSTSARA